MGVGVGGCAGCVFVCVCVCVCVVMSVFHMCHLEHSGGGSPRVYGLWLLDPETITRVISQVKKQDT